MLISTRAENRAVWGSLRPRAHMPRAKSNTAEMRSPHATSRREDYLVSICDMAQQPPMFANVDTTAVSATLPSDLKT